MLGLQHSWSWLLSESHADSPSLPSLPPRPPAPPPLSLGKKYASLEHEPISIDRALQEAQIPRTLLGLTRRIEAATYIEIVRCLISHFSRGQGAILAGSISGNPNPDGRRVTLEVDVGTRGMREFGMFLKHNLSLLPLLLREAVSMRLVSGAESLSITGVSVLYADESVGVKPGRHSPESLLPRRLLAKTEQLRAVLEKVVEEAFAADGNTPRGLAQEAFELYGKGWSVGEIASYTNHSEALVKQAIVYATVRLEGRTPLHGVFLGRERGMLSSQVDPRILSTRSSFIPPRDLELLSAFASAHQTLSHLSDSHRVKRSLLSLRLSSIAIRLGVETPDQAVLVAVARGLIPAPKAR